MKWSRTSHMNHFGVNLLIGQETNFQQIKQLNSERGGGWKESTVSMVFSVPVLTLYTTRPPHKILRQVQGDFAYKTWYRPTKNYF